MVKWTIPLTLTLFLLGCGNEHSQKENPLSQTTPLQAVTTLTPIRDNYPILLSAPASVEPSPDGIVTISTPLSGFVDKILVHIGDNVSKGTTLLTLRSADSHDLQNNQDVVQAQADEARRIVTMNQELLKLGAITQNDFLISQNNLRQTQTVLDGLKKKKQILGVMSNGRLDIPAPIHGVVYGIDTHIGELVDPSDQKVLMKIADPTKKILVASVYEKDLPNFHKNDKVTISLQGNQSPISEGVVKYVSDVLDPESKTVKVFIQPSHRCDDLKINMFVSVSLASIYENVYKIPKTAILYKDGKFIVFKKMGEKFEPQAIELIKDDPTSNNSLVRGLSDNVIIAKEAIRLERQ